MVCKEYWDFEWQALSGQRKTFWKRLTFIFGPHYFFTSFIFLRSCHRATPICVRKKKKNRTALKSIHQTVEAPQIISTQKYLSEDPPLKLSVWIKPVWPETQTDKGWNGGRRGLIVLDRHLNSPMFWFRETDFGFVAADCERLLISCHVKTDERFIYSTSLPSRCSESDLYRYCSFLHIPTLIWMYC